MHPPVRDRAQNIRHQHQPQKIPRQQRRQLTHRRPQHLPDTDLLAPLLGHKCRQRKEPHTYATRMASVVRLVNIFLCPLQVRIHPRSLSGRNTSWPRHKTLPHRSLTCLINPAISCVFVFTASTVAQCPRCNTNGTINLCNHSKLKSATTPTTWIRKIAPIIDDLSHRVLDTQLRRHRLIDDNRRRIPAICSEKLRPRIIRIPMVAR